MKTIAIVAVAALSACAPQATEPPANESGAASNVGRAKPVPPPPPSNQVALAGATSLTAEGWGPLRIGMTRDAVEAVLGADANPGAVGGPDPAACDQFTPQRAPKGMLVMVEKGALTRISLIRDAEIATDRDVRLKDPAAKVRAAYGKAIEAEPHAYTAPEGGYLTSWARGGGEGNVRDAAARGIRYEIGTDDRVAAIHAGGPSIQNVEGCA